MRPFRFGSPSLLVGPAVLFLTTSSAATAAQAGGSLFGPWTSTSRELRVDWPTFGNGPSHTGYFPDVLGTGTFQPSWSANLGGNIQQVAIGEGRVYATPEQYFGQAWLKALDPAQGTELWSYPFSTCFSINPPTFDAGQVYVQRGNHGSDTQLWSFHADSGVPSWITPHSAQWERYLAPTVADGKIWVNGGYYGGMYGFEQSDGAQLFFEYLPQYDEWTPSYYAGRVYSWVAGVIKQHDPVVGTAAWSLDLGWNWSGWSMNRTSAITNSRAYLIGNPDLHAIDLSNRRVDWSVSGNFRGTPAVANGAVYAIESSLVKAFDAGSGAYKGVYVGSGTLVDQPIVTDDAILFSSDTATFVYDIDTYQSIQTIPFGGHLSLAGRRLYIASGNGNLRTYQIAPASPPRPNLAAEWDPWEAGSLPGTWATRLRVANSGSTSSAPCRMVLVLSKDIVRNPGDRSLRLLPLPPIAPGETLQADFVIPVDAFTAGQYVLAIPDPTDIVAETNEQNVSPSNVIP